MELRHLEYFVSVAEERSFTAAAARLHVVQSAVSAGIKALEREVGVTLLDRTSRRVEVSDAGRVLLPHAYRTLDAARVGRDALADARHGLRGTIRVGTMISVGVIDVPGLLGDFHRRHPGVVLQLSAAPSGSRGLVEAVVERRLDLAFVSLPGDPPPGVVLTELGREPMDLVVPGDHPLAGAGSVSLTDLTDFAFIDSPPGFGNRVVVDRAFSALGLSRRVTADVADIATVTDYVRNGLGIALLPRFALTDVGSLAVLEVSDPLEWPMSLATPADRTPTAAAAALAGLIRDSYAQGLDRPGRA
ncbi:LysR family transcriptional regulator [Aeromicrobium chenweiae]|uniref:LysR family transcriptional regulator n=1 Tax=Aeromicrobium chenweiae TaxID=2079793 RepID=A0A2S0WM82_9ACTN|nr:LysR family transcriptional regulator [Aeromicrobium chenweiae]AWB92421.1 LysR family transcriptional regulator [Aeromicrobium chenweiae]TGN31291.1 LysR family transcriptional regulator [Aeromicrobium chenweiae]